MDGTGSRFGLGSINIRGIGGNRVLTSNSPYSFILGLMSVFSCFGTGNRRFQTVCMAYRRALERVPGIDMQVS